MKFDALFSNEPLSGQCGQWDITSVVYSEKTGEATFHLAGPCDGDTETAEAFLSKRFAAPIHVAVEALAPLAGPSASAKPSYDSDEERAKPVSDASPSVKKTSEMVKAPADATPLEEDDSFDSFYSTPIAVPTAKPKEAPAAKGEAVFGRFGKKDTVIPLDEVLSHTGVVNTVGIVSGRDPKQDKETKNNSKIIQFELSDRVGHAITCKLFLKEEESTLESLFGNKKTLEVRGQLQFDPYKKEQIFTIRGARKAAPLPFPLDHAPEKRIELSVHTQMSNMEGLIDVKDLGNRLEAWGHDVVGITDTGSLQAYPNIAKEAKAHDIKVLYGYQAKLLHDEHSILFNPYHRDVEALSGAFTVFDLETTGFSRYLESIIEIGAVRYEDGVKVGEFSVFVNPGKSIPPHITELTSITDQMVADAERIETVLPQFLSFAENSIWVAHNAAFDVGFIREKAKRLELECTPVWMDTLGMARALHPEFKNHKLDTLTKELQIPLLHHHRAIDDAEGTGGAFLKMWAEWEERQQPLSEINTMASDFPLAKHESDEALIYCPKQEALKNFYQIVSIANLEHFAFGRPGVPYSVYEEYGEDLYLASGFVGSELFRLASLDMPDDVLLSAAEQYDVIMVEPDDFTESALQKELVADTAHYREVVNRLIALGSRLGKPVLAMGAPAYLDPGERLARNILVNYQRNIDFDANSRYQLKMTQEMLDGFSWLDPTLARRMVIEAPREFADTFESITPVPPGTHAPEMPGAPEELEESSLAKAHAIYGDPLPEIVRARLKRELDSIIGNGFAPLYVIARRLVLKSQGDGYLVGSRGSVGSSFVATMSDITEVNPLPPHYVCPKCQYSEFIEDGSVESGFDLPAKDCPVCGTPLRRDGHTIPFEVFLGFNGDKEPDIDLNFAGPYMPTIHKYTEELFGEGKVYRAGTIAGVQEKTAYGFLRKYQEQPYVPREDRMLSDARIRALQATMSGTKRTTGQHPGGLMIVPQDMDILDVTPVQYPADDAQNEVKTTHFSFKDLDHCLLKLDELGHTVPTIISELEELTGIDPLTIPFDDRDTMDIFLSGKPLKPLAPYANMEDGSLGIPEFGTKFVRGMLKETNPRTFGELVRISGLSHGTNVWRKNAQDLIQQGTTDLQNAICTRDDVMNYLIRMGLDKLESFKTMEAVRKNKPLPEGAEEHMREHGVPEWYIESCKRVEYLFPKAHATAYVMMSYRIAWFKVHQPAAFYATYFTQHLSAFCSEFLVQTLEEAQEKMEELLEEKRQTNKLDNGKWTLWEIVEEMYARGLRFAPPDLMASEASRFVLTPDGSVLPPFAALDNVSEANGLAIVAEREEGEFISRDEFRKRTGINKSAFQSLVNHGLLDHLPESNQMSFLIGF
ncbi:MAG: PolC-type DNA polymerase III [Peptoniphilaceae bacterium]|nr:PolC-type DNA polymerase III [Peptoniphilaceae bacterium]MDY6085547.1 PolC-type DNA polymerase III [Peptoniphilaceae bacterium]